MVFHRKKNHTFLSAGELQLMFKSTDEEHGKNTTVTILMATPNKITIPLREP
jgi:hypothetical protein